MKEATDRQRGKEGEGIRYQLEAKAGQTLHNVYLLSFCLIERTSQVKKMMLLSTAAPAATAVQRHERTSKAAVMVLVIRSQRIAIEGVCVTGEEQTMLT